jgi:hypothetical protein
LWLALSARARYPRSLRAFRQALGRANGDLRRVARDATWLLETYNSLVSLARTAMPIPTIGR